MIAPGATIGILGGGQLGRMLACAAARLGYRVHVFAPEADSCAADVAAAFTCAQWDDEAALDAFAAAVDVVTFEFENVPVAAARRLAARVPVRPGAASLEVAQDRLAEKRFATAHGGRVAPFVPVATLDALVSALDLIAPPAILKTRRLGYDGKGQARIDTAADAETAWAAIGAAPAILEARVDFVAEMSVLVARGIDGGVARFETPRNEHREGILHRSIVPAGAAVEGQIAEAAALAERMAAALEHVGVVTVEFFVTPAGPLVNELAPRVHNSGHWTVEAARTSQFENHIRAVCGLPLGPADTLGPCEMLNLIGAEADDWAAYLADPRAALTLYGKGAARPGRKMGHVVRRA